MGIQIGINPWTGRFGVHVGPVDLSGQTPTISSRNEKKKVVQKEIKTSETSSVFMIINLIVGVGIAMLAMYYISGLLK
jgi:hypothetical protein